MGYVRNDRLIAARRRLASPFGSGLEMSRQELADAVNVVLYRRHGELGRPGAPPCIDGRTVAAYERGRHRWPGREVREAFRIVLGAATDVELGFYVTRRPRPAGADAPDQALSPAPAKAGSPTDAAAGVRAGVTFVPSLLDRPALDWLVAPTPTPDEATSSLDGRRVTAGEPDIASLSAALTRFRQLDHEHGAGAVSAQVRAYMSTDLARVMRAQASGPAGAERLRLAAQFYELAGYQLVDLGADGVAQRRYLKGLRLASVGGDRLYGAYLLGVSLGHLALHCGYPADALRVVHAAWRGAQEQLTPRVRAALQAVMARCHARLGDSERCTAALVAAEQELHRPQRDDDPPWMGYFTPADLLDEVAHCALDLGWHRSARDRATEALHGLPRSRVRRRAIDTALLGCALARAGRADEAAVRARQAVDLAAGTGSHRSVQRVTALLNDLDVFVGVAEVDEVMEYARHVLPQADPLLT